MARFRLSYAAHSPKNISPVTGLVVSGAFFLYASTASGFLALMLVIISILAKTAAGVEISRFRRIPSLLRPGQTRTRRVRVKKVLSGYDRLKHDSFPRGNGKEGTKWNGSNSG